MTPQDLAGDPGNTDPGFPPGSAHLTDNARSPRGPIRGQCELSLLLQQLLLSSERDDAWRRDSAAMTAGPSPPETLFPGF